MEKAVIRTQTPRSRAIHATQLRQEQFDTPPSRTVSGLLGVRLAPDSLRHGNRGCNPVAAPAAVHIICEGSTK